MRSQPSSSSRAAETRTPDPPHYTFIIVGFGPVGATLAHLLSTLAPSSSSPAPSLLVLESSSSSSPYPLPRAVHLDAHSVRLLRPHLPASPSLFHYFHHCTFLSSSLARLLSFPTLTHPVHDLSSSSLISQPELEAALRATLPSSVSVLFSSTVASLTEGIDGVTLVTEDGRTFTTDRVLACDGGRGRLRGMLGARMERVGGGEPGMREWLVVDGQMDEAVKRSWGWGEAGVYQVCDAERPMTVVSKPGTGIRVEVIRQPEKEATREGQGCEGQSWRAQLWDAATYAALVVWSLLAPLLCASWAWTADGRPGARPPRPLPCPPLHALLPPSFPLSALRVDHCTPYRVHSLLASAMVSPHSRVFLLGDAAHLTPPYLGQGLCLGLRDAASLAFRLSRSAGWRSWERERREEAREAIVRSAKVGQLVTLASGHARATHRVMRAVDRWGGRIKRAFTREVAVNAAASMYGEGRGASRGLLLWPRVDDSDRWMFSPPRITLVGIDCDARAMVDGPAKAEDADAHYHWVHLTSRGRWREWLSEVGITRGVAVVRPDRFVFALYALTEDGSRWQSVWDAARCRRRVVTYSDERPFPVFRDVEERLFDRV